MTRTFAAFFLTLGHRKQETDILVWDIQAPHHQIYGTTGGP